MVLQLKKDVPNNVHEKVFSLHTCIAICRYRFKSYEAKWHGIIVYAQSLERNVDPAAAVGTLLLKMYLADEGVILELC